MIWYRNDTESLQTHCTNTNGRQKQYRNKQASTQHPRKKPEKKRALRWHMIQWQIRQVQCLTRHLLFIYSVNRKAIVYVILYKTSSSRRQLTSHAYAQRKVHAEQQTHPTPEPKYLTKVRRSRSSNYPDKAHEVFRNFTVGISSQGQVGMMALFVGNSMFVVFRSCYTI